MYKRGNLEIFLNQNHATTCMNLSLSFVICLQWMEKFDILCHFSSSILKSLLIDIVISNFFKRLQRKDERDYKLNIYHVTYYCIFRKKHWGFFFKSYSPESTLKLAAYIRTSENGLNSPNIGCYLRVKFSHKKFPNLNDAFPIYNSKLHVIYLVHFWGYIKTLRPGICIHQCGV